MILNADLFTGMTVEIKAKGLYNENRYNQDDTKAFLNYLSILARRAADQYRIENPDSALAKEADGFSEIIYKTLKQSGYYNSVGEN